MLWVYPAGTYHLKDKCPAGFFFGKTIGEKRQVFARIPRKQKAQTDSEQTADRKLHWVCDGG